jgi:hypothetical protein
VRKLPLLALLFNHRLREHARRRSRPRSRPPRVTAIVGKLPMKSGYGFGELALDHGDRLVGHSGGDTGVSADAYTYWNSGYTIVVLSNLGPPASHDVARGIRKLIEVQGSQVPQGR